MKTFAEMLDDPHAQYLPLIAPMRVVWSPGCRNPTTYRMVLDQLPPGKPRYAPRDGVTWCNIFLWDATSAMDAAIPHWVGPDGTPMPPSSPGSHELRANETVDRLGQGQWGWHELTAEAAYIRAHAGYPTVVGWKNPKEGHPGHVGMVEPFTLDGAPPGIYVAQAGAHPGRHVPLQQAFPVPPPLHFFTHE